MKESQALSKAEPMPVQLVMYTRSYCHLCDDMQQALAPLVAQHDIDLVLVDVDADPHSLALYDELVPVLVARLADGSEQQICHYFLDVVRLTAFLSEQST